MKARITKSRTHSSIHWVVHSECVLAAKAAKAAGGFIVEETRKEVTHKEWRRITQAPCPSWREQLDATQAGIVEFAKDYGVMFTETPHEHGGGRLIVLDDTGKPIPRAGVFYREPRGCPKHVSQALGLWHTCEMVKHGQQPGLVATDLAYQMYVIGFTWATILLKEHAKAAKHGHGIAKAISDDAAADWESSCRVGAEAELRAIKDDKGRKATRTAGIDAVLAFYKTTKALPANGSYPTRKSAKLQYKAWRDKHA